MRSNGVVIPVVICAMLGCAPAPDTVRSRDDSVARHDSIAAVVASSLDDAGVLGLLNLTNAADSALGLLGAQKGTTADVKEFGRMILREHNALLRETRQLGQQLGIEPRVTMATAANGDANANAELHAAPAGIAWDRAYLDRAIQQHLVSMENAARALAASRRAEINELIERSAPILQKHLDKARSIRRTLPAQRDTVQ